MIGLSGKGNRLLHILLRGALTEVFKSASVCMCVSICVDVYMCATMGVYGGWRTGLGVAPHVPLGLREGLFTSACASLADLYASQDSPVSSNQTSGGLEP